MNISERGIDLIKEFEGVRLSAYDDGVGVITIGYGHTSGVRWGDRITQDEAENLLIEDLEGFERCVENAIDVPLTQPQFDALVSFAFNVGCGALHRSTLRKKLNEGDYEGAADQLLRWNRGGGRVLRGLVRRREAERALFLYGLGQVGVHAPVTLDEIKPTLRKGDNGIAVRDLQLALRNWTPEITVDGYFGPHTESFVREFQDVMGLVPDGIVGANTWAALEDYL